MAHGHTHGNSRSKVEVSGRAKTTLIAFLALLGVLAVSGLVWLWPTQGELAQHIGPAQQNPGVTYEDGTISGVEQGCQTSVESGSGATCETATVLLLTGPEAGETAEIELLGPQAQAGLRSGDSVEVARIDTGAEPIYSYSGTNRMPVLIVMTVLFVLCVLGVARWKGLFALVGLGIAAFVLLRFMLPALIVGKPGMAVALTGSTAIMFVVLYVAHGISIRTSTALAGTLLGLCATTGLGYVAAAAARLSGFSDEMEFDLAQLVGGLNFRELLMVAIIIGGLGVLNDVTITQSSSVWELRAAAPEWTRRQVFAAGMRIGRDHIASTIYTIVFAYAGGALTVLLLLYFTDRQILDLFGVEMFATEAVRTLASAIGLVLAVPITTGIAAMTIDPAREPESLVAG